MSDLTWLVQHRFQSLTRREYDWLFVFDEDVNLVVTCLWRLLEGGHIRFTSKDEGHWFGLSAPVNAAAEVNHRLADSLIESVEIRQGILDLELRFSTGHVLEVIPNSAGYEAWNLVRGNFQLIAVGGGELVIFDG